MSVLHKWDSARLNLGESWPVTGSSINSTRKDSGRERTRPTRWRNSAVHVLFWDDQSKLGQLAPVNSQLTYRGGSASPQHFDNGRGGGYDPPRADGSFRAPRRWPRAGTKQTVAYHPMVP